MTKKGKKDAALEAENALDVGELLASLPSRPQFDFNELEPATIGRVVAAITRMGYMVTFFGSKSNDTFSLSIRAGEAKQSYDYAGPQAANSELTRIAEQFELWAHKRKQGT